ncbi:hypothetical protein GQ53DRAFT_828354 [Thozetella sp. PMI_491]|nr:hypothetical protein GQ53DRAFT_828354 [Thozetella sp. PMI_491]
MKFLCLHGMGTSSQVCYLLSAFPFGNIAAFRYELADQHSYEWVQGVVQWELPPELASLANPSGTHYAYYDITSPASFIAALDSLEAYIEAEGPFDGVMAYSQGAGLVTMLLVRRQYLQPGKTPLFRCAILFSPVQVYDPVEYVGSGKVKVLDSVSPGMAALPIPVSIIYGDGDKRQDECRGVQALCDPDLLSVYVHQGGHEIPGLGAKSGLLGSVKMARRCITLAEFSALD